MPFMTNRYSREKMDNGVWREHLGCRFLVRSTNSRAYLDELQNEAEEAQLYEANSLSRGLGLSREDYSPTLRDHRISLLAAKSLLADWSDVSDVDGNNVEATVPNRYFTINDNPVFRYWLTMEASNIENFRSDEAIAADNKARERDDEAA